MKGFPKGLGPKGYWKSIALTWRLGQEYGLATVWQKIRFHLGPSGNRRYLRWCQENEPDEKELQKECTRAEKLPYRPLISVVMPVYNPALGALDEAVRSVLRQTYPHWELCIADGSDGRRRSEVQKLLKSWADRDPRIRVKGLDQNRGIAGNSNAAMAMAKGEFLALLDHDDMLAPSALFRMVERLNREPQWDLLYSDRDLISWDGRKRFHPFFKPEWSPEALLSVNYLIHLALFRKDLLESVGWMNPELDGAQDWDLFFRIMEATDKIVHIPGILYHWRVGPTSTAWSRATKPNLLEAQMQAIQDHCRRTGKDAEVVLERGGAFRIRWRRKKVPKVSLILIKPLNRRRLFQCLRTIREKTAYPEYEIVSVRNRGDEEVPKETFGDDVRWVKVDEPLSESCLLRMAVNQARGEVLVFWDDRLEITSPDWLEELTGWAGQKAIGGVGGMVSRPPSRNDRKQSEGGDQSVSPSSPPNGIRQGVFGSSAWYENPPALSWNGLTVRKEILQTLYPGEGDFPDPSHPQEFWEKIRKAGYRNLYTPFAGYRIRD